MPDNATNQSVERAVALLRALSQTRGDRRATDVAAAAGVHLSTASRLLATLESLELVERDPTTGAYRLGPLALAIGGAAVNQAPVHAEARMVVQTLAGRLGLGVNVARRYGTRLQYLINAEGPLAAKSFVMTGQTNPLHATGLGKCLLLGLDAQQRRRLLPAELLVACTAKTLTSHEELDRELAQLQARGFAVEDEELALGRACVAAPIRDAGAQVVAAVSVSGPLSAMDLDHRRGELAQAVIEAADAISTGLGFTAMDGGPAAVPARGTGR